MATVAFSRSELELLRKCSENHYESACQAASKIGGFLYGMLNRQNSAPETCHPLSFDDLDMLAKISECRRHLDSAKAHTLVNLHLQIMSTLKTLNNSVPQPVELSA